MRALIFSDYHVDNYRRFNKEPEYRLKQCYHVANQLVNIIEEKDISVVIFLGDLFNGLSESLPKSVFWAVSNIVQLLSDYANLILVPGNHDLFQDYNLLKFFNNFRNIKVIESEYFKGFDIVGWNDCFPMKSEFLLGHLDLGMFVHDRVILNERLSYLKKLGYKKCILGHYHIENLYKDDDIELIFIRSVMQNSFSDMPSYGSLNNLVENGCYIYDDGDLTFVPINSPKFITLNVYNEKDLENIVLDDKNYFKIKILSKIKNNDLLDSLINKWNVEVEQFIFESKPSRIEMDYKNLDVKEAIYKYIDNDAVNDSIKEHSKKLLDFLMSNT